MGCKGGETGCQYNATRALVATMSYRFQSQHPHSTVDAMYVTSCTAGRRTWSAMFALSTRALKPKLLGWRRASLVLPSAPCQSSTGSWAGWVLGLGGTSCARQPALDLSPCLLAEVRFAEQRRSWESMAGECFGGRRRVSVSRWGKVEQMGLWDWYSNLLVCQHDPRLLGSASYIVGNDPRSLPGAGWVVGWG